MRANNGGEDTTCHERCSTVSEVSEGLPLGSTSHNDVVYNDVVSSMPATEQTKKKTGVKVSGKTHLCS